MAKIVICSDGTWSRPEDDPGEDHPGNVLRLARGIAPGKGDARQQVFYDWGLGSYHSHLTAGVMGCGIHKNILDAYRYIVQNYAPGDAIYLFGFSRGAYTARALSGLINNCGILKRNDARLIARAWRIYKSPARKNHPGGEAAENFRQAHSHSERSRQIHFIGVWDTVGALGIPFSLMGLFDGNDEFYDTRMGPNVTHARHALAIDEKRADFAPTLWAPRDGVDLKQVWFAGCHADVGGGHPPDKDGGAIADVAMHWMLTEAASAGLNIERHLKKALTNGANARLHESRRKLFRFRGRIDRELIIRGKPTTIHPTVKARYEADPAYRPPRLKALVEELGWDGLDVGA